jgi:hypothetical protein
MEVAGAFLRKNLLKAVGSSGEIEIPDRSPPAFAHFRLEAFFAGDGDGAHRNPELRSAAPDALDDLDEVVAQNTGADLLCYGRIKFESIHFLNVRSSHRLELVFADAAQRADPILGKIGEFDAVVLGRIVNMSANLAYVFHLFLSFLSAVAIHFAAAIFYQTFGMDFKCRCKFFFVDGKSVVKGLAFRFAMKYNTQYGNLQQIGI